MLVSPSVTTGWDFPEADYLIIAKIPYPDTQPKVVKARIEEDKEWAAFTAMETLIQEAGRGSRCFDHETELLRCVEKVVDEGHQNGISSSLSFEGGDCTGS